MTDPTIFQADTAHAVIVGLSVFGIFWGVTNAILVRSVKFDVSVIENTLGKKENKSE